jgi:predicted permease
MLGIQLSAVSLRAMQPAKLWVVLTACGVRLVIGPIILFGLTALFGLGGLARQVAIIQMSMPTAVNVSLLAEEYKSDREFVSASILISTLGSLFTLSVLLSLV